MPSAIGRAAWSQSAKFSPGLTVLTMAKLPECAHCQYCLNSPYLVCGVNPHGHEGLTCNDFVATPEAEENTERNPLGGGYYVGDWIPQPFPDISQDEQLALLDWHPQFTGR